MADKKKVYKPHCLLRVIFNSSKPGTDRCDQIKYTSAGDSALVGPGNVDSASALSQSSALLLPVLSMKTLTRLCLSPPFPNTIV